MISTVLWRVSEIPASFPVAGAIPRFGICSGLLPGLESMVLGETEIFGQVKRAYEAAARSGTTGRILNRLFQKAFHVGKHVRSATAITRGSCFRRFCGRGSGSTDFWRAGRAENYDLGRR